MIRQALRLVRRQMDVQFRLRIYNPFFVSLYFFQPAIFSAVGMILSRAAGQSQPDLVYSIIGGGVLGMWSGLLFSSTFDITGDRRNGTLEFIVGSPTSLGTLEAIRTLTNVLAGLISMLGALLVAVLIFGYTFQGVNIPGSLLSLLIVLIGLWVMGVFLANLLAWSRLGGSAVNYLESPIAVFCAFMYPLEILPVWMQTISMIFPIRWGLEALYLSLKGSTDWRTLIECWSVGLVVAVIYWLISLRLERLVHDKIRITGEFRSI